MFPGYGRPDTRDLRPHVQLKIETIDIYGVIDKRGYAKRQLVATRTNGKPLLLTPPYAPNGVDDAAVNELIAKLYRSTTLTLGVQALEAIGEERTKRRKIGGRRRA